MDDILIICEHHNGKVRNYSKELCYKISDLADHLDCGIKAIIFGIDSSKEAQELGEYGVSTVYVVKGDAFKEYNADLYLDAIHKAVKEIKPSYIFATASQIGSEILPRLAVRLGSGIITGAIELRIDDGDILFKRPVYSGNLLSEIRIKSKVKLATVRPNIFDIGEYKNKQAEVKCFETEPVGSKVIIKNKIQADPAEIDLVESNIIVSGGRAMGNADNYELLRELAEILNGGIAASRSAVDAGFISHDQQIGQTGRTVNPALYIACGISGAVQHLAGMRTSKCIIAINKDPDAPIFSKADFGIVGDLFEVIPEIIKSLKKFKKNDK